MFLKDWTQDQLTGSKRAQGRTYALEALFNPEASEALANLIDAVQLKGKDYVTDRQVLGLDPVVLESIGSLTICKINLESSGVITRDLVNKLQLLEPDTPYVTLNQIPSIGTKAGVDELQTFIGKAINSRISELFTATVDKLQKPYTITTKVEDDYAVSTEPLTLDNLDKVQNEINNTTGRLNAALIYQEKVKELDALFNSDLNTLPPEIQMYNTKAIADTINTAEMLDVLKPIACELLEQSKFVLYLTESKDSSETINSLVTVVNSVKNIAGSLKSSLEADDISPINLQIQDLIHKLNTYLVEAQGSSEKIDLKEQNYQQVIELVSQASRLTSEVNLTPLVKALLETKEVILELIMKVNDMESVGHLENITKIINNFLQLTDSFYKVYDTVIKAFVGEPIIDFRLNIEKSHQMVQICLKGVVSYLDLLINYDYNEQQGMVPILNDLISCRDLEQVPVSGEMLKAIQSNKGQLQTVKAKMIELIGK